MKSLTLLGSRPPTRIIDRDDLLVIASVHAPDTTTDVMRIGHQTPVVSGLPLPPAASMEVDNDGARVSSDPIGLRHLSMHQAQDCALVSTSALAVAAVMECELSPSSWATLALTGYLLEDSTLFEAVERLPGRCQALLKEGNVSLIGASTPLAATVNAEDGPSVMRESVRTCLEFAPDAGLELSGGLDSRMILAAIPQPQRYARRAITLGRSRDPDVTIAADIARRWRLEHTVLDPTIGPTQEGRALLTSVIGAARRLEHASDPIAAYTLASVEERLPQGPRFSGVNGEAARGTFYVGNGSARTVTRSRVSRLAAWRLFANHRVDGSIFKDDWLPTQQVQVIDRITTILQASEKPWDQATDEYRRTQRMRNWAGLNYSAAASRRPVLAPFLHPAFLGWVDSLPPSQRAGSRAFARALVELDPTMGDLPLDSGLKPRQLADGGVVSRLARGRVLADKVGRKTVQRLRNDRRPASRSATLVQASQAALHDLEVSAEFASVPWLDPAAIERCIAGPATLDQPTLGFLINVIGVKRFMQEVNGP